MTTIDAEHLGEDMALGVFFYLFLSAAPALAGTITKTVDFDMAERCDNRGCFPWNPSLELSADELQPMLPQKTVRLLMPTGERFKSISVKTSAIKRKAHVSVIAPRERHTCEGTSNTREAPAAYSGGVAPASWTSRPIVREIRGYQIVEVKLFPARAVNRGTITFVDSMEIEVETESTTRSPLFRGQMRDLVLAKAAVDNPEAPSITPLRIDPASYLIIGSRELLVDEQGASQVAAFAEAKTAAGLNVMTSYLEDIGTSATQIRAHIQQQYQNAGVDFVLLVGNAARLAWKNLNSGVSGNGNPVPSDQYYACLDGDFSTVSRYDWACEVAVGRVGAASPADVQAWMAKTLELESLTRNGRSQNVLHYGEKLDSSTLGGRTLDYLIGGHNAAPATVGFPATVSVTKLHDTFSREVPASEFIGALNSGDFVAVNHLGHANNTYVFRMDASRITELMSRPAFFYSQGCYPNNPDSANWTVQAVNSATFGPAAMIANSRYGWYQPGSSGEGTSNRLHRAFWSARFGNGILTLGGMNHLGKEIAVGASSSSLMVYTALESNLIGDPALDLGIQ